ncbi:MAG: HEAT repeat domain-containing protein [Planctomycetes bacterium]|nr:HEAT repeat domain-containing protein [Planctomycetota bacterium]
MRRFQLLFLLPFLLVTAFLPAQADLEGRLDAVKEFNRYFRKAKEEALQVEAVMTLEGNECVPAAESLIKLLSHKSEAVQDAALTVLASYRDPATFQAWIDELPKEKDNKSAALTIKLLGRSEIKSAVPAIEEFAANARKLDGATKYEIARALTAIGDPGKSGLLGTFVDDEDAPVRMAAADAIAKLEVKELAPAVTKLVKDDHWQVQSAAIEAVATLRPQAAVQPLIDVMRESGRLRTECADALFRITALDFGVDPERWQQQWDKLMSIDGWRIPTDEEMAQKAASRKKYDAFYGKKEETNAFAGIPTTSTNVLFVIDVSGSMDDLVIEVDKFREYKDRKRFTIVQTELLNTIETLSKDTNFNIVAFATDVKPWKKRLVPANVVNRDSAMQFVKRLKPIGGSEAQELAASGLGGSANLSAGKTNTLKALMYGFGIDPEKPKKAGPVTGYDKTAIKRPLDTIYFLSDGRPSAGKLIEPLEILAEIRKHNELFRIVIHTIAIGDFQKNFLEQLARENGGVFVDLGR